MTTLDFSTLREAREAVATGLVEGVVVDRPPRCWRCHRALAEYAARPWSMRCRHCREYNRSAPGGTAPPSGER